MEEELINAGLLGFQTGRIQGDEFSSGKEIILHQWDGNSQNVWIGKRQLTTIVSEEA